MNSASNTSDPVTSDPVRYAEATERKSNYDHREARKAYDTPLHPAAIHASFRSRLMTATEVFEWLPAECWPEMFLKRIVPTIEGSVAGPEWELGEILKQRIKGLDVAHAIAEIIKFIQDEP